MRHLIVGRTSCLGLDLTEVLGARGDAVVGTSRNPVLGSDIKCDVRSTGEVTTAVLEAERQMGGVDSLVYLAGQAPSSRTEKLEEATFMDTMDINTVGAFRFAKAVLSRSAPCCITFVGTSNALRGSAGQAAYATSKAGLLGLTRSLAAEFGPRDRRVNLVAPGYFSGGLTNALSDAMKGRIEQSIPARRLAKTREITEVIAFAASPASSYMNGSIIYVDGGLAMGH